MISWAELEVPDVPETERQHKLLDQEIREQEDLVLKRIVALTGTGGGSGTFIGIGKLTTSPETPRLPDLPTPGSPSTGDASREPSSR